MLLKNDSATALLLSLPMRPQQAFAEVRDHIGPEQRFTQKGMRRTFHELARVAKLEDIVTRSISGHSTELMRHHDSTLGVNERRESISRVFEFTLLRGGRARPLAHSGGVGVHSVDVEASHRRCSGQKAKRPISSRLAFPL